MSNAIHVPAWVVREGYKILERRLTNALETLRLLDEWEGRSKEGTTIKIRWVK